MKKRGKVFCFFVVIRKFFVQQLLDNAVYVCYPLENQDYICGEEQTMQIISMDLSKRGGKIKPVNAVNNGPTPKPVRTTDSNFDAYAALEIPYARNHDASFCGAYGGEHTVDVHRIFKNFDADENDPASYIFEPTDEYVKLTHEAGTQTFYRLGAAIEHRYKYGVRPPKDFKKWARICEHIIAHYTEGWADGFHYDIEYWEIWNEPDCHHKQGDSPTWTGTMDQFCEFFETALYHLKERFPHLKIGGPAFCSLTDGREFIEHFFEYLNRNGNKAPLDFFSWHLYGNEPTEFERKIRVAKEILDKYGYGDIENHLNEWNYIKGWRNEEWKYSINAEQSLKGASFVAGAMCVSQALPLDMLMYYDARPCVMNGIFDDNFAPRKTYYIYEMFRDLRKLGTYVPTTYREDGIYTCVATNEKEHGLMVSYFDDNDEAAPREVCIESANPYAKTKVEYYLLDETHNNQLARSEIFTAEKFQAYLTMTNYSTYYIKITEIK